jgi:hypothetical protein
MDQTEEPASSELWGGLIDMPQQHIIQIALLGAVLGAISWVGAFLAQHVVLMPLLCGAANSGACLDVANSSANAAAVIIGIVGLLGLVRLSIYRPLLIVLAVVVSLWGMGGLTAKLQWYEALSWSVVLYAFCYLTFAWLVRPRSFAPTVALVVIAVVVIRLFTML